MAGHPQTLYVYTYLYAVLGSRTVVLPVLQLECCGALLVQSLTTCTVQVLVRLPRPPKRPKRPEAASVEGLSRGGVNPHPSTT